MMYPGRTKAVILYTVFLLIPLWVDGQFFFRNIHTREGLSSRNIYCTYKDREGFVWFGTDNGLNRYDGSHIKLIDSRSQEFPGLVNDAVSAITGYGKDQVWVATKGGVCYLDKKKNRFIEVPILDKQDKKLRDVFCSGFILDGDGHLWTVSFNGLYRLDDTVFRSVGSFYMNPLVDSITCISGDYDVDTTHHALWIGGCIGLIRFDYRTGEVLGQFHNPRRLQIFAPDKFYSLAMDHRGNVWMSSEKHGLLRYNYETDSMMSIAHLGDKRPNTTARGCHTIYVDGHNRVWISTNYLKAFVLLPDGTVHDFTNDLVPEKSLAYGLFHDVYEDRDGNIWIATVDGVSLLPVSNYIRKVVRLPSDMGRIAYPWAAITELYPAPGAGLWIGKYDGLYYLALHSGAVKRYTPVSGIPKEQSVFSIKWIEDAWWCATGKGIQILDTATGKFHPFKNYAPGTDLDKGVVYWLDRDRKGRVWFSIWEDGVYRYDPATRITTRLPDPEYDRSGNTSNLFAYQDTQRNIWISYGDAGVRVFDWAKQEFYDPFINNNSRQLRQVIYSMTGDSKGNKYMATSYNGILVINSKNRLVDSFTTASGLLSNRINFVYCEKNGRLWAASTEGVQFKHPGDSWFSKVPLDLGTPLKNSWSVVCEKDNQLYISYNDYLATIDLKKIQRNYVPSPPLISSVQIFDKEIPFSYPSAGLKLKYEQNYFTVSYSSPMHDDIPNLQYAYKLEGYDDEWIHAGRRQTATYTGIPDGAYRFLVKNTDGNGQWLKTMTAFPVIIKHPFWKTWWFILSVALALFMVTYELVRRRRRYLQRRSMAQTIEYFANSVYDNNSVGEICWDIARNCIARLKFEDCVVYLAEDGGVAALAQVAAYGPKNPAGHEIANPIIIRSGEGIVGTVAATGQPLLVADTSADPRYIVDDKHRLSELAVPILHEGKVLGVIDSEHTRKGFFNQQHLKTLTTIASISASRIAKATAEAAAREHELQLLQIRKLLAESQLVALRAQMNPHFVFNCLNSIQECIVTGKYGEGSRYLNKFSKLFRNVLNNSDKKLVSLADEEEVLRLYLELEHMRFEQSFEYTITADEDLEMSEILIPSMLVQPFVENALWHGLMHKMDGRRLDISFVWLSDEMFRCIVEDNGIGRKRSAQIKKQQTAAKKHESKGLGIAMDRVALLKRQGFHAALEIIDKLDASGVPAGTKVVIELSSFLS